MRVLIATPLYPPQIGGPATYARILNTELPRYKHDVTVVNFGDVRRFPPGIRHLLYFFRLARHARACDLVLALDPFSAGLPALLVARLFGKRFVVKIVGDFAWEQLRQRRGKSREKARAMTLEEFQTATLPARFELYRTLERDVARAAARVIVPSAYLREIVAAWGVHSARIHVVYNAFTPPHGVVSKEEARRKHALSGTVVVSAGRLVPWKGFGGLIEATAALSKEIPDIKLYIAGTGPLSAELKERARLHDLTERVHFLGKLEQGVLHEYVRGADVFVLNSTYEGFSHTLLEVFALGTPVVATAVGGNPELVENGATGLLVPPDDRRALKEALRELLENETIRGRYRENAQRAVGTFTPNHMMSKTLAVLSLRG